ncbi:MAG: hypothetical protein ACLROI_12645 [Beduini sp.]|uniref:hypothetical protein n=1 Tax=Beduini sp. TaxID=1922300 RepID=UPI003990A009
MEEKKKIGRPTDSVKNHEVKARIDDDLFNDLVIYAKKNHLNNAQVIRLALIKLIRS